MHQDAQDRIQRALNEQKRRRLEDTYGARFSFSEADAPPELIGAWLDTIEEFEQQLRDAPRTTVRAFTGNPAITPPGLLPPERIAQELRNLLAFLDAHAIALHFSRDVPPEVLYRFVVDELLDLEIDDVRMEGLTHNFIYEDFHPDDATEATSSALHFLHSLFRSDSEVCRRMMDDTETYSPDGRRVVRHDMECAIDAFLAGVVTFTRADLRRHDCMIQGGYATVRVAVSWCALLTETLQETSATGVAQIRLKRAARGWNVVQIQCPGWSVW